MTRLTPIARVLPNVITILGMCSAMSGLRFALSEQMEISMISILIASVIDGMDGSLARFLNSTTTFGANLDSLADFLSFGAVPGLIMYFWKLKDVKIVGWMLTMIYILCMALRLARFNAKDDITDEPHNKYFFPGIPAPVGALLYVAPIMLTFSDSINFPLKHYITDDYIAIYLSFISFLIISTIPTISFKYIRVPRNIIHIFTALMGILIVLFVTKPWIICPLIGATYLISIPITSIYYAYLSHKK